MNVMILAAAAPALLSGAGAGPSQAAARHPDAGRVLVVVNERSRESLEIGRYYMAKRGVPAGNLCVVSAPELEEISEQQFQGGIASRIRAKLAKTPRADFVVLTKGVPIRIAGEGHSVDAEIAAAEMAYLGGRGPDGHPMRLAANPYFGKRERFSSSKFRFRLVTRLDGYSAASAKRLVDLAMRARPEKGLFLFDEAENRKAESYEAMQRTLGAAHRALVARGFRSRLDTTERFVVPGEPLAGYAGWGSNDSAFTLEAYRRLRFKPGAICETFVSTSGRTFLPTRGGQSLIADLIDAGVTGVKGYVSEPYTIALAKPDILFDRYTRGFNLAESFYMASPVLKWKDIVIGDPLCAPYSGRR